jgi:hypothetical protein
MKHWKTQKEIGDGFQYNENQHKKYEYNSLIKVSKTELSTMRTMYLMRDIWTNKQLDDLLGHLKEIIKERKE